MCRHLHEPYRTILRTYAGGDKGNETAVKQSLPYIQLEKQNERLKEALIRYVGGLVSAQDFVFKSWIIVYAISRRKQNKNSVSGSPISSKIYKDSMSYNVSRTPLFLSRVTHVVWAANYESTLIKLANAEVQVEDLKLQLDDALGAEEMLVQLTERNLMLGEVKQCPVDYVTTLTSCVRKSKRCALPLRISKRSRNSMTS